MAQQPNPTQTIEITNFGGRLTRIINGDLNSGMANFVQSWGYDPFSKPMNLTWLEQPTSILSNVGSVMLAAKTRTEGLGPPQQYIYSVDSSGTIYKTIPNTTGNPNNPNVDTTSVIGTVSANTPNFSFGGSLEFYNAPGSIAGTYTHMYIGSNNQINSVGIDGSGDTAIAGSFRANSYRPLRIFSGKLVFGNGNTVGAIDSTGTVTSSVIGTGQGNLSSEINPALPVESTVHDLDISPDGNYLLITASNITNERIANTSGFNSDDAQASDSSDGAVYYWNGSDATVTAINTIPSYAVTALQTYLGNNMFFSNDTFGASVSNGINKILTLQNNKPPLPNATLANGNFLCWIAPELSADGTTLVGSLYYFGSLDQENPPGLFRLMRYTSSLSSGFVFQTPLLILTNNKYTSINPNRSGISPMGYGKHYFSTYEVSSNTVSSTKFFRFLVTPSGTGTSQLGVYQTQTQLFSNRVAIKQIRVYTEPTATGNGFQLDCIGSDGSVISGGTFTYSYAAGSDVTKLQGALERISFYPTMKNIYSLGLRITNTGTTNMTIQKIEVDWQLAGE